MSLTAEFCFSFCFFKLSFTFSFLSDRHRGVMTQQILRNKIKMIGGGGVTWEKKVKEG